MRIEQPELKARLTQILGGEFFGSLSVLGLKLYGHSATVELKMSFDKGNIPPNFLKRENNALIFSVLIPDFSLRVTDCTDGDLTGQVLGLSSKSCAFNLGRHQYHISAAQLHFDGFQSVNEMNLVDQEW